MPDPISVDDFLKGTPAEAPAAPGLSADDFLKGEQVHLPDTSRRGGSAVNANPDNPDQVPFTPLQARQYDRLLKDKKTDAARLQSWFKGQGIETPSLGHVQSVIDFVRAHPTAVSPTYYTRSHDPTYGTPSEDASYHDVDERTFGQQFTDSMQHTASSAGEGLVGVFKRAGLDVQDDDVIRSYGSEHNWTGDQIDAAIHQAQEWRKNSVAQARQQFEQRSDNDARLNPDGALGRVASNQLGGIVGDANPTYLIAPEIKPLTAAIQRIAPTLGHVVAPLAEQIAERLAPSAGRAAGMGATQAVTDAAGQAADMTSGQRDNYDPVQTAEHAVVGAAMQGGLEGVLHGVPAVKKWWGEVGSHEATPAVEAVARQPEALTQLDQDIQLLESKGLTASHFRTPEEVSAAAAKLRPAEPAPREPSEVRPPSEEATASVTERQAAGDLGEKAKSYGTSDARPMAPDEVGPNDVAANNQSAYTGDGSFRSSEKPAEPDVGDVFERMTAALKTAGKASKEQQALVSAERSERIKGVIRAQHGASGEGGYHAALGALKGELPKVDFEPVRPQFDQREVDVLFDHIVNHDALDWGEKLSAHSGLKKLLEGKAPAPKELSSLAKVTPAEFIKAAMKQRSRMDVVLGHANNAINLPRSLVSTADLSIPLRQGVFMVGRKEFYTSFVDMFKQAARPSYYEAEQAAIKARPSYPLMKEAKLAITDMGHDAGNRPEQFRSNWAEHIPVLKHVVKFSERGAVAFSNKLRADVFDSMLTQYNKAGVDIASNPQGLKAIGKYLNAATGRGNVPFDKIGKLAGDVFFSPQLLSSRITLLNPATYILERDPILRANKLRDLAGFGGVAATVTGLAALSGAKIGTDPLSSNWGKMQVGNTHIDIFGGFQQFAHLAAVLAMNERTSQSGKTVEFGKGYKPETRMSTIGRFLRSKESPAASIVHDYLEGTDYLGNKPTIARELISHFIPFSGQDIVSGYQDSGIEGAVLNTPSVFGVGTQTYGGKAATPKGAVTAEDFLKGDHPSLGADAFLKGKATTVANAHAEDILRSVGLTPTDTGVRSHAAQEEYYRKYEGVAVPGTSAHESGNAIDIAPSKTVRPEDVVATLEGNGYTGVKIITRRHGSGPHWHVEWDSYAGK